MPSKVSHSTQPAYTLFFAACIQTLINDDGIDSSDLSEPTAFAVNNFSFIQGCKDCVDYGHDALKFEEAIKSFDALIGLYARADNMSKWLAQRRALIKARATCELYETLDLTSAQKPVRSSDLLIPKTAQPAAYTNEIKHIFAKFSGKDVDESDMFRWDQLKSTFLQAVNGKAFDKFATYTIIDQDDFRDKDFKYLQVFMTEIQGELFPNVRSAPPGRTTASPSRHSFSKAGAGAGAGTGARAGAGAGAGTGSGARAGAGAGAGASSGPSSFTKNVGFKSEASTEPQRRGTGIQAAVDNLARNNQKKDPIREIASGKRNRHDNYGDDDDDDISNSDDEDEAPTQPQKPLLNKNKMTNPQQKGTKVSSIDEDEEEEEEGKHPSELNKKLAAARTAGADAQKKTYPSALGNNSAAAASGSGSGSGAPQQQKKKAKTTGSAGGSPSKSDKNDSFVHVTDGTRGSYGSRTFKRSWSMEEVDVLQLCHARLTRQGKAPGKGASFWADILKEPEATVLNGRSSVDLKDKWRNLSMKKK